MFWKSKSRIPDGCIQLALGFLIVMGSAWLSFAPHGQMLASLSVLVGYCFMISGARRYGTWCALESQKTSR
jgi:hypothetical protein